jgi:hypothetical protein
MNLWEVIQPLPTNTKESLDPLRHPEGTSRPRANRRLEKILD